MRFLMNDHIETAESYVLSQEFNKYYAPRGEVAVGPEVELTAVDVELVILEKHILAINANTVSWSFVDSEEAEVLKVIIEKSCTLEELVKKYENIDVADFIANLYRRGLVHIDGHYCTDPTMFYDSSNLPDQHLVELLVTERCNLACGYCLAGVSDDMPKMEEDIAKQTIDRAMRMNEAKSLTFEFSGGEPFLRFGLLKALVVYINSHPEKGDREPQLTIQTNATLLNDERVKWISDNRITVGVSLDGNPESHNQSRPQKNGKDSFDKVSKGLDLLQKYNVSFGALVVLNRSNINDPEALLDFLVKRGITSFKCNPMVYLGTGRKSWDRLGITSTEAINYFKKLFELIVSGSYQVREANIATMLEYWMSKRRSDRCLRGHCGAGDTFQAVAADGTIFPCGRATQSPGLALGNVKDSNESLSRPAAESSVIAEIRDRSPDELEGCDICHYRQLCQSGCSVESYERYGTVRHRTPQCDFFKTLYPWLLESISFDAKGLLVLDQLGYFRGGSGATVSYEKTFIHAEV